MPGSQIWCGGRWWTNYALILETMREEQPDLVIEGEQRGADLRARAAAEFLLIPVDPHPAQWGLHGKLAGPIRNREMLLALLASPPPHKVVAFHDDVLNSRGTVDMLRCALAAGIQRRFISGVGALALALIMAGGCTIPRPVLWPKPGRLQSQMTAQEVRAFDQGRESAEHVPRGVFVKVKVNPETGKQIRGFASMDKDKAKDIQSRGGTNAHLNGTAHVFGHRSGKKAVKQKMKKKRG
jgi:hypothetical protein